MTVRTDDRLLDTAGADRLSPLWRDRRGAAQTSAMGRRMAVQVQRPRRHSGRGSLPICSELRASLEDAARGKDLPILGENPVD